METKNIFNYVYSYSHSYFMDLNYDIIFIVLQWLDINSLANLALTCKSFWNITHNNQICRKVLKKSAPYSAEAILADCGNINYTTALFRIHSRRDAVVRGRPAIALSIPNVSHFSYKLNVICYLSTDDQQIKIIDSSSMQHLAIPLSQACNNEEITDQAVFYIHYESGVLSVAVYDVSLELANLHVTKVNLNEQKSTYFRNITMDGSPAKIFVCNTDQYLYYGFYAIQSGCNHNQWNVIGASLTKEPFPTGSRSQRDGKTVWDSICLTLDEFTGQEITGGVDFMIKDDYFYGVSNGDEVSVREVDFTSLYKSVRFPLNDPIKREYIKMFRRQHREEGVINDYWTNMTIQLDERNNELMIAEGLMQWRGGKQHRTFYTTQIKDTESILRKAPNNHIMGALTTHRSRYLEPDSQRQMAHVHEEQENLRSGDSQGKTRTFIPLHTKHKIYNLSATTFIDIVNDVDCCKAQNRSCIRFRFGSKRLRTEQDATVELFRKREELWQKSYESYDSDEELLSFNPHYPKVVEHDAFDPNFPNPYQYGSIGLWPENSTDAHDILNIPLVGDELELNAISDERNIVYLLKDPFSRRYKGSHDGKLVFVSFDKSLEIGKWNMLSETTAAKHEVELSRQGTPDSYSHTMTRQTSADNSVSIVPTSDDIFGGSPERMQLDFDDDGWGAM